MSHCLPTTSPDIPRNTFSLPAEGIPKVSFDMVQDAREQKKAPSVPENQYMEVENPTNAEQRAPEPDDIWEEYDPEKE
jgi:hypothetical protein